MDININNPIYYKLLTKRKSLLDMISNLGVCI